MNITTINYAEAAKATLITDFANFIRSVNFYYPQARNLLAFWVDNTLAEYPAITSAYTYGKDDLIDGETWHVFYAFVENCPEIDIQENIFHLTIKSGVITAKYKQ